MGRFPSTIVTLAVVTSWLTPPCAGAHPTFRKCPKDSVKAGDVCMDTYEASVWRVPDPTGANKRLVKKIQKGAIKNAAQLLDKGAVQLGVIDDDYGLTCADNGGAPATLFCKDVFAVSLAGVIPSAHITWFQAQQACANSQKHLPSNAEWQQAAAGSPDPGGDNGTTDCKTTGLSPVATGSRVLCKSRWGAFDMVGNLTEWTADWVPASTAIPGWGPFANDLMSLSGASTTAPGPGALLRGGSFFTGSDSGPLAVDGSFGPSVSDFTFGFRCAR